MIGLILKTSGDSFVGLNSLKGDSSKLAFTLAEVLITLAIIGVVAALTIPTLMNNYQKQEYLTSLKKMYSATNQVLQQVATDAGCSGDLACTGLFSSTSDASTLGAELVKYFRVTKDCKMAFNQGCWPAVTNWYYDGSYTGANETYDSEYYYKFVTNDGMSFLIDNYSNDCNTPTYSTGRTGHMAQTCGAIFVDVNGTKKPNAFGRDTFLFLITNGKGPSLYPYGGADDKDTGSDEWWKNPSNGNPQRCYPGHKWGYFCTGRVIEESWQMNY